MEYGKFFSLSCVKLRAGRASRTHTRFEADSSCSSSFSTFSYAASRTASVRSSLKWLEMLDDGRFMRKRSKEKRYIDPEIVLLRLPRQPVLSIEILNCFLSCLFYRELNHYYNQWFLKISLEYCRKMDISLLLNY